MRTSRLFATSHLHKSRLPRHCRFPGALLRLALIATAGFLLPALSPAQQAETPPAANAVVPALLNPAITVATQIEPGCLLHVTVAEEPGLTGDYEVDEHGTIHFALSDAGGKNKEEWTVTVGKKTADEARGLVIESLKKYLLQPEVHLALVRLPRLRVDLAGTGCNPCRLELPLDAHLSDILIACKLNADYAHILLVRKVTALSEAQPATPKPGPQTVANTAAHSDDAPTTRALAIDFTAYQQGEGGEDLKLQDGDKIYIQMKPPGTPEHVLRTARIVGEVEREVDVPLAVGMTVKEALARAGGLKDTADGNKIRLHRGESGRDYELKAASIAANDPTDNMPLLPGDYIIVYKKDLSMRWGIDGEVMTHSVFPYLPGMKLTVTKAVAIAGGLTKKADHRKGILRKGFLLDPTKTRDIVFDYDAIKTKKQTDFEVEAGDVVVLLPRRQRPTFWQQLLPLALKFIPLPF